MLCENWKYPILMSCMIDRHYVITFFWKHPKVFIIFSQNIVHYHYLIMYSVCHVSDRHYATLPFSYFTHILNHPVSSLFWFLIAARINRAKCLLLCYDTLSYRVPSTGERKRPTFVHRWIHLLRKFTAAWMANLVNIRHKDCRIDMFGLLFINHPYIGYIGN